MTIVARPADCCRLCSDEINWIYHCGGPCPKAEAARLTDAELALSICEKISKDGRSGRGMHYIDVRVDLTLDELQLLDRLER
jgi:hypothetical protein